MVKPRIISHRCLGFGLPENSRSALKKALASKVDEVEVDIRLTADRYFVLCHDAHYRDKEGGRHRTAKQTLENAQRAGLLPLEEALEIFKESGAGKILNIELKAHGGEALLVSLLKKYKLMQRVRIVSMMIESLENVHRLAPKVKIVYAFIPKVRMRYDALRPNGFAIRLPYAIRTGLLPVDALHMVAFIRAGTRLIRKLTSRGFSVEVVNADSIAATERLLRLGARGVLTNNAPVLLKHFKK